jgi:hypothetical protein
MIQIIPAKVFNTVHFSQHLAALGWLCHRERKFSCGIILLKGDCAILESPYYIFTMPANDLFNTKEQLWT